MGFRSKHRATLDGIAGSMVTPNIAIDPTVQQRRFASTWPAGYRER